MRARPLLTAVALGFAAASAFAAPLQRLAVAGPDGVVLERDAANAVVRATAGRALALRLPAGASLDTLAGERAGWAAAGTRPLPRDQGTELVLVVGDATRARTVRPPAGRVAAQRDLPQPVLERGELAGLVWLEGPDRGHFAVRAAAYDGARWSAPETVAAPDAGSQMAPAVALLPDGAWLAVWSRYNGHDDDVVWSVRRAGGWSAPVPVHAANTVPDVTPALLATPDGAVVAWSQFDGEEYRVEVARFARGAFEAPRTIGGRGWLSPLLARAASGAPVLQALQAEPRSWAMVELDDALRPARVASVLYDDRGRPLLRAADADGVRVTFARSGADDILPWRAVP